MGSDCRLIRHAVGGPVHPILVHSGGLLTGCMGFWWGRSGLVGLREAHWENRDWLKPEVGCLIWQELGHPGYRTERERQSGVEVTGPQRLPATGSAH
ncbi:hypothetical protein VTK73DRAFT_5513 [Phialemonium thermophilum]|uniref:Uncharacterized protein n=1 Tax=Phialemonium thermophilum TaxID=223376 RepID=A0ABR3V1L7_9PEZI